MDYNFDPIRCYNDGEVQSILNQLMEEGDFIKLLAFLYPGKNPKELIGALSKINTVFEFQSNFIYPYIQSILANSSSGITSGGFDKLRNEKTHFFISNHRDIVMDPSFLNVLLHQHGLSTCEIAAGDNLLAFPWIEHLLRLNKTFIVNRNISVRQLMLVSKRLSAYIQHVMSDKKHSVWMAQREGRSKDANDRTAHAILKMLNMGGELDFIGNMKQLSIMPISISYEYDPCDYLKAKEFLLSKLNPTHKKTQKDDLDSMYMGLTGQKGQIHFQVCNEIKEEWPSIESLSNKNEQITLLADSIDRRIHKNYKIYPGNYVAYDLLHNAKRFENKYSADEKAIFEKYLAKQIDKTGYSNDHYQYLEECILTMYANPLINFIEATH